MLNPSKGNMYGFVTHTWNAVKGKCPHACSYCYMRQDRLNPIRLDEKEFDTDFGQDKFIFVGSSCDMWAWDIPKVWIDRILEKCRFNYRNRYLFQSKNPERFRKFCGEFTGNEIFATTLESNREYHEIFRDAPGVSERYTAMTKCREAGCEVMITIEPILDFDLKPFVEMISDIKPVWINIGADSKGHKLPEPSAEKIRALIDALKEITEVKIKKNLRRILTAG
jgi:DNA repair photolyase